MALEPKVITLNLREIISSKVFTKSRLIYIFEHQFNLNA
jgi:hypothetical protein